MVEYLAAAIVTAATILAAVATQSKVARLNWPAEAALTPLAALLKPNEDERPWAASEKRLIKILF